MKSSTLGLVLVLVACPLQAQDSGPDDSSRDLSVERALLDGSNASRAASDYPAARDQASQAVAALLARPEQDRGDEWLDLLSRAGMAAYQAQDPRTAHDAWKQVHEIQAARLPDDDPDLQRIRGNFANSLHALGDLAGARALRQKVFDVRLATLPDDHPDLQKARANLAITIKAMGELVQARILEEKVLAVRTATLPDDHPDLQSARSNLALTIKQLGRLEQARDLEQQVLDVLTRVLPDEHPNLQVARGNLATTLYVLGDLAGARAMQEQVLEVYSRTMPEEHSVLQFARVSLAATIKKQGDLDAARALEEQALAIYARTLPGDHFDLQRARTGLALTLKYQGDLEGARVLEEDVLSVLERVLPPDHPDLQAARGSLAETLKRQGDTARARVLEEQAVEVGARTLPGGHPNLRIARQSLVETLALEVAAGAAPAEAARARCAELVTTVCRDQVRAARLAILGSSSREAEARCAGMREQIALCLSLAGGMGVFEPIPPLEEEAFVLSETTRAAAVAAADLARRARGSPRYAELSAALQASTDELAGLAQAGASGEDLDHARSRREAAERELSALAQELSGGSGGHALDVASVSRALGADEAAIVFRLYERRRLVPVEGDGGTQRPIVPQVDADSLCAFVLRAPGAEGPQQGTGEFRLVDLGPIEPVAAAVAAWRAAITRDSTRGGSLAATQVDESACGQALRRLVLDPVLPAVGDARRVIVVLDDVLNLVPLDALPEAGETGLIGDRWSIETRSTLSELLAAPAVLDGDTLVALGGPSFNLAPLPLPTGEAAAEQSAVAEQPVEAPEAQVAALLRGGVWERGFAPLTHTADEARGLGALYTEVHEGTRPVIVLEKRQASREALEAFAPQARFLHVATHGWFAPESVMSWDDAAPIDPDVGLLTRASSRERIAGLSPMLLCGLALAGANLSASADSSGRLTGLVTAEELSTLDLSRCELAVLSACDTNVGIRRAGQGVASLRKALQMAGARSVITSLWKVPDEATKELMLDFYRRLWVEGKPKGQALWESKLRLRDARDEHGAPLYTTRDWAGWVLTGEPE